MVATTLLLIASAKYREAVHDATVVYTAEAYNETIKELESKIEEPKTVIVEVEWSEESIKKEVWSAAAKYNTFPEKMWNTVKCEGTNPETKKLDPKVQSFHRYPNGEREQSFGLAQFHIPSKNKTADGTVITKEMAQDPVVALDAMAYHFSIGNARLWSCYRMLYM